MILIANVFQQSSLNYYIKLLNSLGTCYYKTVQTLKYAGVRILQKYLYPQRPTNRTHKFILLNLVTDIFLKLLELELFIIFLEIN